jgi:hypothetical protein
MAKKTKTTSPPKKRNPLALNPLLKKSHPHSKSKKAERSRDKNLLRKEVEQQRNNKEN